MKIKLLRIKFGLQQFFILSFTLFKKMYAVIRKMIYNLYKIINRNIQFSADSFYTLNFYSLRMQHSAAIYITVWFEYHRLYLRYSRL